MKHYLLVVSVITHQLCHVLLIYISDIKNRSSGRPGVLPSVPGDKIIQPNKSLTLLWGATGEQEWTPALTTGEFNNRTYKMCNCILISIHHHSVLQVYVQTTLITFSV
jgi:hypothetical protein